MAKNPETARPSPADYLHWTARADHLEDIEEHLNKAARLSRFLWEALCSDDTELRDMHTRAALLEIAYVVADPASAAKYVYVTQAAKPAIKPATR